MLNSPYRGRFAPSPTGPLHFGSLIAAVGSYLQARANQGEWWLRIEDIDPPREPKGTADNIIRTLESYGFEWHGPVQYQHNRLAHYAEIINKLAKTQRLYHCSCSRKQISQQSNHHEGPLIYPGTCRSKICHTQSLHLQKRTALRMNNRNVEITFKDVIKGEQKIQLEQDGDYVIRRTDGHYSYQLAVAVDDAEQGMTEVVRGADLLSCTARQIYLQQCLNLPTPQYAHLPVANDLNGQKLSKQSFAQAIDEYEPSQLLWYALTFLGQKPERTLLESRLDEIWQWAIENWKFKFVPKSADIDKDIYKVC
jgi:glutamyl-Q tRNA(Asp) synthetase